jgi:hypothetical protein
VSFGDSTHFVEVLSIDGSDLSWSEWIRAVGVAVVIGVAGNDILVLFDNNACEGWSDYVFC